MDVILLWATLISLTLFWAAFVLLLTFDIKRHYIDWSLLFAAFIFLTAAIVIRWILTGHPPILGTLENSLAGSWFVVLLTLITWRRYRAISLATTPIVILVLIFGVAFNTSYVPLTISERSLWVYLHAFFAWLAFSSYTLAVGIAVLSLWRPRAGAKWQRLIPQPEIADDLMFKALIYGFIMQTIMITTGAYYEFLVFGRWWRWDPVESLSLVSWFTYALIIHLKRSFGWKLKQTSILVIAAYLFVMIGYWALVYFPQGSTFHIFEFEGREHIL